MSDRKTKHESEKFQFGPWVITATRSHILESEGELREKFESALALPQLPEMIFADNVLRLDHSSGFSLDFTALEALKLVDAHNDPLKVAVAQAWTEARAGSEFIREVIKPFDWTYTTNYRGTVRCREGSSCQITDTDERIDMEKLKIREKIHFYSDILLFEDELADNGTSSLNVKIRVMPTSFFILLRFFMRVDNVIVRICDTRIYQEAGKDFLLREFSRKDDEVKDIKAPSHAFTDANEISTYLTERESLFEKIEFPKDVLPQSSKNLRTT
ncbi:hypothetical protein ScPMuIL_012969 [Solemya velum]